MMVVPIFSTCRSLVDTMACNRYMMHETTWKQKSLGMEATALEQSPLNVQRGQGA